MPDDASAAEVQRIIAAVTEARCRGEALSDDEVLDSHPDIRAELRAALPYATMIATAHRRRLAEAAGGRGVVDDAMELLSDEELEAPIDLPAWIAPPALDDYDLGREIGRGGQAVVYRGTHRQKGGDLAVKVLHGGHFAGGSSASRFRREIRILLRLRHPNVVGIVDHGRTADGSMYLVMPYIGGTALDEHDGAIAGDDAAIATLFAKVAEAVDAVHVAGVFHRDLKPSNVRVDAKGQPHVLDFGLATSAVSADLSRSLTGPGQILGSLPWASPEQARGEVETVDARSDVYAIGLMLCRAISEGHVPPYAVGGPPHQTIDNILNARPRVVGRRADDPLAAVVMRCLAKRARDRYPTAAALAADLRRIAGGGRPTDANFGARSARWRWVGGVAVATAVLAVAIGLMAAPGKPAATPGRQDTPLMAGRAFRDLFGFTCRLCPIGLGGRPTFVATALTTQAQIATVSGVAPAGPVDGPAAVDQKSALAFCKRLALCDHRPARLPTTAELQSLRSIVTRFRSVSPQDIPAWGIIETPDPATEWTSDAMPDHASTTRPFRVIFDP